MTCITKFTNQHLSKTIHKASIVELLHYVENVLSDQFLFSTEKFKMFPLKFQKRNSKKSHQWRFWGFVEQYVSSCCHILAIDKEKKKSADRELKRRN